MGTVGRPVPLSTRVLIKRTKKISITSGSAVGST